MLSGLKRMGAAFKDDCKVMSFGVLNNEKTVCVKIKFTLTDRHADMNTRTQTQSKYTQAQHLRSHFGFSTSCAATLSSTSFTASKKHQMTMIELYFDLKRQKGFCFEAMFQVAFKFRGSVRVGCRLRIWLQFGWLFKYLNSRLSNS